MQNIVYSIYYQVAIIVPFRNRELQLPIFLRNIIPFLQSQSLEFGIFVTEQVSIGSIQTNVFNLYFILLSKRQIMTPIGILHAFQYLSVKVPTHSDIFVSVKPGQSQILIP